MAGTEGSHDPFFSPDGEWVGFFSSGGLKKVPIGGGPAVTIYNTPIRAWGASWGAGDQIVFANFGGGLMLVPAASGEPQSLVKPDPTNQVTYASPWILPDGKTLLFTKISSNDWSTAQIVARRMDAGEDHVVLKGGSDARYLPTNRWPAGHLVYMQNAALMAIPFDAGKAQVQGRRWR
jgi:serine/threonine-protein kinase